MLDQWIADIKRRCEPGRLGMILLHNGIVRATTRQGAPVTGMNLSYDSAALNEALVHFKAKDGIEDIRVWINSGKLQVGDDIMVVCVAGRFRTDILPVFTELLTLIKTKIVREEEL